MKKYFLPVFFTVLLIGCANPKKEMTVKVETLEKEVQPELLKKTFDWVLERS